MPLLPFAKKLLRKFGVDVTGYHPHFNPRSRREYLFDKHRINLVLDVGANVGQYGAALRRNGYRGRTVSYEPSRESFQELQKLCRGDSSWECVHAGLGAAEGVAALNVAPDSQYNSILEINAEHAPGLPSLHFDSSEQIKLTTLNLEVEKHCRESDSLFVKIDTQGYERQVLAGANLCWERIRGIQMEMSLKPLYEGEMLYAEAVGCLEEHGYKLVLIEFCAADNRTDELLQVDGTFFRSKISE